MRSSCWCCSAPRALPTRKACRFSRDVCSIRLEDLFKALRFAARRLDRFRRVDPHRFRKALLHRYDPRRDVRGRDGGTRFSLRDDRSAERRRRPHAGARLPSGSWRKTRNSVRSRGSPRLRRWPKLSSCDRHGPGPSSSCRRSIAFEVIAASDGSFAGRWFSTQLCPAGVAAPQ